MSGYTGKILRINLTTKTVSTIDTAKYEQWGGGHGIGSAIFWDLVPDKTISAFDPRNVVTIMTSPLAGTLAPSAGRTEVQGIGPESWPTEWFTRSNFGGRFSAMLKSAGWDGVVLEGKADKPVWVNIVNDNVVIEDANGLWGLDTYEAQEEIWRRVTGNGGGSDWTTTGTTRDGGRTTQRPAVVCIGPAGENLSRIGSLTHDAGSGAGQGGFGGVFGSKNLKAVSVLGTGSVSVADPRALMESRQWFIAQSQYYNTNADVAAVPGSPMNRPQAPGYGGNFFGAAPSRSQGCSSCYVNCRRQTESGTGNGSQCVEAVFYAPMQPIAGASADVVQRYGINAYHFMGLGWLRELSKMGILGPGKQINSNLPFDQFGTLGFLEALTKAISFREDIGADLAEGWVRAAEKWGRLGDLDTGLLAFPSWGYPEHYDPRSEVEWSYGSILGDRDINEHCFNFYVHWMPLNAAAQGVEPPVSAKDLAEKIAAKLVPYNEPVDPMMLDYSPEGVYSDSRVKEIAWHRHYTRFFKQSLAFCDWAWPDFMNTSTPELLGSTPEAEPKFYNAVTGQNITFEDGMEIGRKIWNLDKAIWVLQGRHRDQEVHAGYVYKVGSPLPDRLPMYENGEWTYATAQGRTLDKAKFEDWKTRFYEFEGWDSATGWPTRPTLEKLGLGNVADELETKGKLGK